MANGKKVQAMAHLLMVDDAASIAAHESPGKHAFIQARFDDGTVVLMSTNLAEMLGGAGSGLRKKSEDEGKRRRQDQLEQPTWILNHIVSAWQALPEGLHTSTEVDEWLEKFMRPAISRARRFLDLPDTPKMSEGGVK